MNRARILGIVIWVFLSLTMTTLAQPSIPVKCGDILESEFTQANERQTYTLDLSAGDKFTVQGIPLGETLGFGVSAFTPLGTSLAGADGSLVAAVTGSVNVRQGPGTNYSVIGQVTNGDKLRVLIADAGSDWINVELSNGAQGWVASSVVNLQVSSSNPYFESPILSAGGIYEIAVNNGGGGIGIYTLLINCILRDGTIIQPGDSRQPDPAPDPDPPSLPTVCEGLCFAGLPPVDLTNVARIPLAMDVPFTGAVTPTGGEILGYTFSASTDERVTVSLERLSGNLNLGLVILNSNSDTIYQASLVTSELMTTRLRIPADGDYIASVFRIDLLPPSAPEATAFSLTVSTN